MKIKSADLINFGIFDELHVNFDPNVTYLVGNNGEGKTTAGKTGVEFVIQGIAERAANKSQHPIIGSRFRFIKEGATSAKGSVLFTDTKFGCDILAKRKITATTTELSFEAPVGITLDQSWLNSLYSEFCLSPESFCSLSGQEQAKLLGIDVSKEESEIKKLKEEYTYINRRLKELGKPVEVDAVEPVDEKILLDKLQKANAYNSQQTVIRQSRDEKQRTIERLKQELARTEKELSELPPAKENYDTTKLQQAITTASETNAKARKYVEYQKTISDINSLSANLTDNKKKQSDEEEKKTEKIKKAKLPFKNLSIGEEGELLLDGKLIKPPYYSTGELLMIVPMLLVHTNPELKYMFLQEFNLLDEDNQSKIVKYLTENGYQVVCEVIGGDKTGTNVIKLRSNKVVDQ